MLYESGTRLGSNGRYVLEKRLGEGGLGVTFLATDTFFEDSCVVKMLTKILQTGSAERRDRAMSLLKREAKQLLSLRHDGIPAFRDVFAEENKGQEDLFFVQELIKGSNLQEELLSKGAFPLKKGVWILEEVLKILVYLHGYRDPDSGKHRPMLHLDIKPPNLMQSVGSGRLFLIDFGMAGRVDADAVGDFGAEPSTLLGYTKGYSPHEQIRGRVGPASDLYALAITFLVLLTKRPAYQLIPIMEEGLFWGKLLELPKPLESLLKEMSAPRLKDRANDAKSCLEHLLAWKKQAGTDDQKGGSFEHFSSPQKAEEASLLQLEEKHPNLLLLAPPHLSSQMQAKDNPNEPSMASMPTEFGSAKPSSSLMPYLMIIFAFMILSVGWWSWSLMKKERRVAIQNPIQRRLIVPRKEPIKLRKKLLSKVEKAAFPKEKDRSIPVKKVLKAGAIQELTALIGAKEVWIPKGSFEMGARKREKQQDRDERPRHKVRILRGFWMLQTEVTQKQYFTLMNSNPAKHKRCGLNCPVEKVSWYMALDFANRLSKQMKLDACFVCSGQGRKTRCKVQTPYHGSKYFQCAGWRLPTEAEWEYAYRAGSKLSYYTGKCLSSAAANYDGNYPSPRCSKGSYRREPSSVASYKANTWGLFDMAGNVAEWCFDRYRKYDRRSANDPVFGGRGKRVVRGGSWFGPARAARAANRNRKASSFYNDRLGFRLVRTQFIKK